MDAADLLYATICEENRLLAQFIEMLEQEELLLAGPPDIDKLQKITVEKNHHIDQLVATDAKRQALLAQCGFSAGLDGLAQAAAKHRFISEPCDLLLEFAKRAKHLNTSNGATIAACWSHHHEALNQLSRLCGHDGLYDARGRNLSGSTGKHANFRAA
ncbi:flagellar protein FlgN [Allopusillimonas ginsengisoli]|uniref:flagellar protein FlgN n=1 Tax=Allopusillimonas ginsengisoli TaxID=453575 RepID=UPI001020A5EF|nr:flagellar protein FlgN [Allopusillimonas ginsengisoli]TEA79419.1 flagellar protein FlgN [Allopusillimonas ginsengisoli]